MSAMFCKGWHVGGKSLLAPLALRQMGLEEAHLADRVVEAPTVAGVVFGKEESVCLHTKLHKVLV